jgi:hypothetical protein
MAGRTYTLTSRPSLDRDALLRALHRLGIDSLATRWRAVLVCERALEAAQAGESEDWLWGYGVQLALRGHELDPAIGPSSVIAEGYRAGVGLLPGGMPLALDWPLGQRRAIGSMSPGRSWLN